MAAGKRAVIAGMVAMSVALAACGGRGGDDTSASLPSSDDVRSTATTVAATTTSTTLPDGTSLVAQARPAVVQVYGSADESHPATKLDNPNENGAPLVFLVERQQGGWLNVDLPIRPNGSTGWVKTSDVTLVTNPYSIDIALGAHRLVVHKGRSIVLDEPIGVGTAETPTPGGTYYIKELLEPPDPNGAYGPYAYGLSGFSNVLDNLNGKGDGVIGIHGTNHPEAIGTDVSHGCIRLRNEAMLELVPILPLGTPVHISA